VQARFAFNFRRLTKYKIHLGDQTQYSEFAEQIASTLWSAIFVDQGTAKVEEKRRILFLLEEHVKDNLVKARRTLPSRQRLHSRFIIQMGPSFYRQTVGIPQGSVLSTLLCSFFYGDLERTKFDFRGDPKNVSFYRIRQGYA